MGRMETIAFTPQATRTARTIVVSRQRSRIASRGIGRMGNQCDNESFEKPITELWSLKKNLGCGVASGLEGFLRACDTDAGGDPVHFLNHVRIEIVKGLNETASDDWIDLAVALLVAKGAIYIDAAGDWPVSLIDRAIFAPI